jgi:hypothetical protein
MTELQRPEEIQGPRVVHEGRYRLYENPDGGLRIQYRRDGKDEDDFVQLPGPIVALGKAAAEGTMSPIELMQRMMRIMREMRQ